MDLPSTSKNYNNSSLHKYKTDCYEGFNNNLNEGKRFGDKLAYNDSIYKRSKILNCNLPIPMKDQTCGTITNTQQQQQCTIGREGRSYHFVEKHAISEDDRKCMSASDAKLHSCQQLMKNLTGSIHNTKEHSLVSSKLRNKPIYTEAEPSINAKSAGCAEKTTYCRPVVNIYSHEFIQKTMEKNKKLESLVNKLLQVRACEKQNEVWNNYINELKNKHGYNTLPKKSIIFGAENENSNIIDECYDRRYPWTQSHFCDNLLNDVYDGTKKIPLAINSHTLYGQCRHEPSIDEYTKFTNNSFCYPTAPEGKLMMLNREKQRKGYARCRPTEKRYDNKIFVKKDRKPPNRKNLLNKISAFNEKLKNSAIQTDKTIIEYCKRCFRNSDEDVNNDFCTDTDSEEIDTENIACKCSEVRSPLSNIENKLDVLIQSIKTFIVEMQSKDKKTSVEKKTCVDRTCDNSCNLNKCKSDTSGSRKKKSVIVGLAQTEKRSISSFSSSRKRHETIDDILYEEMNKSDKVKRDIDEILCNDGQCAVQITFDIPTKDHSTEVTNSFHKENVHELNVANSRRMTIAVNTDPLSLLALFRVSTETVKQILSYVPNIDYSSYLMRLPIGNKQVVSVDGARYLCNICGASFAQPSDLNAHIKNHNLQNSRNCCVCRHVMNVKQRRMVLFACRHCGQLFTRAYCRELHEQTCRADNSQPVCRTISSLMLLS